MIVRFDCYEYIAFGINIDLVQVTTYLVLTVQLQLPKIWSKLSNWLISWDSHDSVLNLIICIAGDDQHVDWAGCSYQILPESHWHVILGCLTWKPKGPLDRTIVCKDSWHMNDSIENRWCIDHRFQSSWWIPTKEHPDFAVYLCLVLEMPRFQCGSAREIQAEQVKVSVQGHYVHWDDPVRLLARSD